MSPMFRLAVALALLAQGCGTDEEKAATPGEGGADQRYRFELVAGSVLYREGQPPEPLRGFFVVSSPVDAPPNFLFYLRIKQLKFSSESVRLVATDGRASSPTSFPRLTFVLPAAEFNGRPAFLVGRASAGSFIDEDPRREVPREFRGIVIETGDGEELRLYARRDAG